MGNTFTVGIKNYKSMQKKLHKWKQAPEIVSKKIVSNFKSSAPGWIAKEVCKVYNIKQSEVKPSKNNFGGKKIGNIRISGKTIAEAEIVYQGRLLTLTHFDLSPTAPPHVRKAYTIKAKIKKGKKKTIGKVKKLTPEQQKNVGKNFKRQGKRNSPKSPHMLLHTGNRKEGGINYIPFQRISQQRSDLKAVKTLSLPQMVSNPVVKENIDKVLTEKLGGKLEEQMKKYMK